MSLVQIDTEYSADCVEWCTSIHSPDLLACGTYQLEPPKSSPPEDAEVDESTITTALHKRLGRLLLYKWDTATEKLQELRRVDQAAILDMKWSTSESPCGPLLAIADAEGQVALWRYSDDNATLEQTITCAPSDVLCLSLDWSDRRGSMQSPGSLIVSRSDGYLSLISPSPSGFQVASEWHAHEFEPWIAAWNYWDTNVVFSGGDDCKLKGWDLRQADRQPTFVNKRFDAGVTSIQCHPYVENLLAVGRSSILFDGLHLLHTLTLPVFSYDNTVRLFDIRSPLRPLVSIDVGGGAWRVKWHPNVSRKHDLLVACMHDGFKVLRFSDNVVELDAGHDGGWSVATRFDEHESLAYGTDWSRALEEENPSIVASCSFYDHKLHIWRG